MRSTCWILRSPRSSVPTPCWAGTTGIAAGCPGGLCRGRRRIPIASGFPRSCCSRPRSRRSGPISRPSWRAGPACEALADGRYRGSPARPGRGSAIIRGPAICMPAHAVVATVLAATFPIRRRACAQLPGIGAYTAAAVAAIAFNRHAAVVDGNVERVVSPAQHDRNAAAPGQARHFGASSSA